MKKKTLIFKYNWHKFINFMCSSTVYKFLLQHVKCYWKIIFQLLNVVFRMAENIKRVASCIIPCVYLSPPQVCCLFLSLPLSHSQQSATTAGATTQWPSVATRAFKSQHVLPSSLSRRTSNTHTFLKVTHT